MGTGEMHAGLEWGNMREKDQLEDTESIILK
jgi:hypothetical protein